jgi:hypothetical protein
MHKRLHSQSDRQHLGENAGTRESRVVTEHRVHTSATAAGWAAACCCGWRVVRRAREQRDTDINAHQMANLGPPEQVTT